MHGCQPCIICNAWSPQHRNLTPASLHRSQPGRKAALVTDLHTIINQRHMSAICRAFSFGKAALVTGLHTATRHMPAIHAIQQAIMRSTELADLCTQADRHTSTRHDAVTRPAYRQACKAQCSPNCASKQRHNPVTRPARTCLSRPYQTKYALTW